MVKNEQRSHRAKPRASHVSDWRAYWCTYVRTYVSLPPLDLFSSLCHPKLITMGGKAAQGKERKNMEFLFHQCSRVFCTQLSLSLSVSRSRVKQRKALVPQEKRPSSLFLELHGLIELSLFFLVKYFYYIYLVWGRGEGGGRECHSVHASLR